MHTLTLHFWLVLTWPMARFCAWALMFSAARAEAADNAGLSHSARRWVTRAAGFVNGDAMRLYLAVRIRLLRRAGLRKKAMAVAVEHQRFVTELAKIAQSI